MSSGAVVALSLVPIQARVRSNPGRLAGHGPGWFDSSWELSCGLDVQEGWPADATLGEWIEGWLRHAAGVAGPASPSTSQAQIARLQRTAETSDFAAVHAAPLATRRMASPSSTTASA